ncbi:mannose-6-phosphate isomerase, class I [Alkalicoccus saliphilus]|uniref:Mannose-6-phosphate isomerase n=1 Tax=Alkalicoccus saliphilus TaxID=200989 RepID=A0A2T4U7T6_9BACI|nr:mannose-6-phosphate isomerase, class I [Alkalicoccus saliphilus]
MGAVSFLLRMKPVFKEKVWGGNALEKEFGYPIPSENTGECWGISGHENGESIIEEGPYAGKTLRALWEEKPGLFGGGSGEFPLLVKFIDAAQDLSVQVHPDDDYARKKEGYAYGKTECWYIVSARPEAELVLGHHARSREELTRMAQSGRWDELFRRVPVKKGDFIYVPSGTVHAIGAGIVLLEVQQSSDITYRFYDYDRPDSDGSLRELHIEDSIACSMVPHEDRTPDKREWAEEDAKVEELIDSEFFSIRNITLDGKTVLRKRAPYQLITVLRGEGTAHNEKETHTFRQGDHFVVTEGTSPLHLEGNMQYIVAEPGEKA